MLQGRRKIRVVAFALITPIFFMIGGMNISLRLLWVNAALFGILMAVKLVFPGPSDRAKYSDGSYPPARGGARSDGHLHGVQQADQPSHSHCRR